jgi:hypothetical protein
VSITGAPVGVPKNSHSVMAATAGAESTRSNLLLHKRKPNICVVAEQPKPRHSVTDHTAKFSCAAGSATEPAFCPLLAILMVWFLAAHSLYGNNDLSSARPVQTIAYKYFLKLQDELPIQHLPR